MKFEEKLQLKEYKITIEKLLEKFEKNLCSDLPTAFWERKKHVITLPYEKEFNEKMIPTKARPIQRSMDFADKFPDEIKDNSIPDFLTKEFLQGNNGKS